MNPNGSATATPEADVAEQPEVPKSIRDTLAPLLADRDVLLTERAEIAEKLAAKDHEIKVVEKVLKAGGLLSAPPKTPPPPKRPAHSGVSEGMLEHALETIEKIEGEFTVRQLASEMDVAELTAGKALKELHQRGLVVLAGIKVPSDAKNKSTARHYAAARR